MILVIDATLRKDSRTRKLTEYLVSGLKDSYEWVHLEDLKLSPLTEEQLAWRSKKTEEGDFSDPYFEPARKLLLADKIVIAAPYYDFSFPSSLKCYIEQVCIAGLVFSYRDNRPAGNLKATDLYYVSTAGGPVYEDSYSYGYIRSLFQEMFGVKCCHKLFAENLDILGSDVDGILEDARRKIDTLIL